MHMPFLPTVSVIMPVYNGERFLKQAIDSILNQTFTDFELLVINNGSTDGSQAIIDHYQKLDKRIQVIMYPNPLGFGGEKASNMGESRCKGKYIAKLDADDIAYPERFAKQVAYLDSHPDIFLVGSFLTIIDKIGREVGKRKYPINHDAIYKGFYYRCCVGNPAVMYRNNVLNEPFYDLRFRHFNDYYSLFLRIYKGLRFANLPEYLTKYRVHDSNTVFTNLREKWNTNMEIKRTFVEDFGFAPSFIDQFKLAIITWLINTFGEYQIFYFLNKARLSLSQ